MVDIDEPTIVVGSEHYDHNTTFGGAAWRDTAFRTDKDGWVHCYLCASTHAPNATSSGACIGHIRSKDLKNWEYLPPVAEVGDKVSTAACPSILDIKGKWYVTFVDHGSGGMRWHSSGYEDGAGTYYMAADTPEGPYYFTENPLLLGSGYDRQEGWAGRAAKIDGKWLIVSHTSSKTSFANLKEIVQSEDGGLKLRYFPAIEKLAIGDPLKINRFVKTEGKGPHGYSDLGLWSSKNGELTGKCTAMGSAVQITEKAESFILDADVSLEDGVALGFVLHLHEYEGVSRFEGFPAPIEYGGVAVRLDFELGRVEIEELARVGYAGYGRKDFINSTFVRNPDGKSTSLKKGEKRHLKIIARDVFYEVYLDDVFQLGKQLGTAVSGGIEALVERGSAKFENITITRIESL